MLTSTELTRIRSTVLASFPQTAMIERLPPDGATDAYGGTPDAWAIVASAAPCRVESVKGYEDVIANKVRATVTHMIRLSYNQDVSEKDRITVAGVVYDVQAVEQHSESGLRTAYTEQIS